MKIDAALTWPSRQEALQTDSTVSLAAASPLIAAPDAPLLMPDIPAELVALPPADGAFGMMPP